MLHLSVIAFVHVARSLEPMATDPGFVFRYHRYVRQSNKGHIELETSTKMPIFADGVQDRGRWFCCHRDRKQSSSGGRKRSSEAHGAVGTGRIQLLQESAVDRILDMLWTQVRKFGGVPYE